MTGREHRFDRLSGKLFAREHGDHAVAMVELDEHGIRDHRSGREDLRLLKVTGSAFTRFARDEYTTLPERIDRPLLIRMDVHWRYGDPERRPRRPVGGPRGASRPRSTSSSASRSSTSCTRWARACSPAGRSSPRSPSRPRTTRATPPARTAARKLYTDPFPAQGLITLTLGAMSGRLTTHVLDTARGRPAAGDPDRARAPRRRPPRGAAHAGHQRRRPHRRAAAGDGELAGRHLRADLRRRRALRRGLPRPRAGALHRRRRRTRTTTCRCSSPPGPTARTGAVDAPPPPSSSAARGSGEVSEEPDRLVRRYATPAMREANELVGGWMRDAGLERARGRRRQPDRPPRRPGRTLLLGSHLDTVIDAGRYDGPLGVLAAIAVLERFWDRALPFAVEVIGFADEEGVRYPTSFLGSSAVGGPLRARVAGARATPTASRWPTRCAPSAAIRTRSPRRPRPARTCSATARSTSSRGRCSSAAARRSASSPRSPARRTPRSASAARPATPAPCR